MNNTELKTYLQTFLGKSVNIGSDLRFALSAKDIEHYEHSLGTVAVKNYGGAGILIDVYEEDDHVWVTMDYGVSWIVTSANLTIEPYIETH